MKKMKRLIFTTQTSSSNFNGLFFPKPPSGALEKKAEDSEDQSSMWMVDT